MRAFHWLRAMAIVLGLMSALPLRAWSEGSTSKLNLSLEQTHTIKELIKDEKIDVGDLQAELAVGDSLPEGLTPIMMPIAIGQKVPHIKQHQLVVGRKVILIVDPKDNKIAETIER